MGGVACDFFTRNVHRNGHSKSKCLLGHARDAVFVFHDISSL